MGVKSKKLADARPFLFVTTVFTNDLPRVYHVVFLCLPLKMGKKLPNTAPIVGKQLPAELGSTFYVFTILICLPPNCFRLYMNKKLCE